MGTTALLPSFSFNFKSSCCNAKDKRSEEGFVKRPSWIRRSLKFGKTGKNDDETRVVQPKRPSWIRRSLKIGKGYKSEQEEDSKVVKRTACLQFTQTNEKKIPNETIPDEWDQRLVANGFDGDDSIFKNK